MKSGGLRKLERASEKPVAPEVQAKKDFAEINGLGPKPVAMDRYDRTVGAFRKRFGPNLGPDRVVRFLDKAPVSSIKPGSTMRVLASAEYLLTKTDPRQSALFLKMVLVSGRKRIEDMENSKANNRDWTMEEGVRLFEILIENQSTITHEKVFRDLLGRDEHLLTNQFTRKAYEAIAYESVNFDIVGMPDEEIWHRLDSSPHRELIRDNAVWAMLQTAERLGIA